MNSETINQAFLFIVFLINGLIIGIVFDIFRILRKSFKTSNFMTNIEDTLFWIISAFIIMFSIFVFNNGQFRGYIFIGIFLGITIYMLFFSRIIINISVKLLLFIKSIFMHVFRILVYPFKLIYNLFIKPFVKLYAKFRIFSEKMLKKINKHDKIIQNKEGI